MANILRAKREVASKNSNKPMLSPVKLQLLFTIVAKEKTEFYLKTQNKYLIYKRASPLPAYYNTICGICKIKNYGNLERYRRLSQLSS